MTLDTLTTNIVYPEFITRHYGLSFYHPSGKKLIVPAESFFIAKAQCLERSALVHILNAWLDKKRLEVEEQKQLALEDGVDYEWDPGLFGIKEFYNVKGSDGKVTKQNILNLSGSRILEEMAKRAKNIDGSSKLFTVSGKDAFIHPTKEKGKRWVGHIGKGIELVGKVLSKSDARTWDSKSYHNVRLVGVMEPNAFHLTSVNCTGMSAEYNSYKQVVANGEGYSQLEVLCSHAAALLVYAKEYPRHIDGYRQVRSRNSKKDDDENNKEWNFWSPINYGSISKRTLFDTDKDMLLAEVLISRYLNAESLSNISQRVLITPDILNIDVLPYIEDGTVGFESVVQYQNPPAGTLGQSVMSGIHECLTNANFKLAGFVKEGKWGRYETSCSNYINDSGEEARVLVNKNMPPVVVFRRPIESADVEPFTIYKDSVHPYSKLFKKEITFDDRTHKKTESTVVIPLNLHMHPKVADDYRKLIQIYYPRGLKGFKEDVRGYRNKPFYNHLFPGK